MTFSHFSDFNVGPLEKNMLAEQALVTKFALEILWSTIQ